MASSRGSAETTDALSRPKRRTASDRILEGYDEIEAEFEKEQRL